ncbi:DUF4342 domain-containing protein [Sedimentibacter sp. MB31-C6]|uniref:DUF4342 domain-containing protein n=1 Tax=Sedimentibacter sp. MB31-C6 TaxID=3109366 RepID=UPI002DDD1F80|nr:DUF4342 domain-containing protein [Sedimentibacter sp. MB36-C1]WSI03956.1 DUF4342 domain-containing protein [Sedimentibacter sp. MB36-C1]
MKITLEQIDELRSRVNVSYEEAKKALEKNDGDLIKSIIELEKKKGKKNNNKEGVTGFANKLLELKLLVKNKNGNTLVNLPLVIILLTFIMAFWIVIFGLLLAVATSCKIKIYRDKNSINVSGLKKNMQETVEKIKEKSEIIIDNEDDLDSNNDSNVNNDSDENEIIIE